jgi:ATP-dependent phosphofructokinase / diphosphate-dependent phosphofructokinase
MSSARRRIAINAAAGYVPGLNSVIKGTVLAAAEVGWECAGLRDGFDGLLFPERYAGQGVIPLEPSTIEIQDESALLGVNPSGDPFRMRRVNTENQVEETDQSDELLAAVAARGIDGIVTIGNATTLSLLFRLHRKGLNSICIPQSVENDVAATQLSFGFNSALSYTAETLDRARLAAQAARKIGVVEVLGEHAGWLALQAGLAVCADAVLIPEIPYDLGKIAAKLRNRHGLVVVAEGARPAVPPEPAAAAHPLKASLSPLASGAEGGRVIDQSGQAARNVALALQRLTDQETYPLTLGQLVKSGPATVVDRQLGVAYGAGAVRALAEGHAGVMVAFDPPDLRFVPFTEAINRIRTIPAGSVFLQAARSLGIALGD